MGELNLFNNQLTGSIPSEIGNLTSLHRLALGRNHLTGSIPPELGNLFRIGFLDLKDNQLTGSIPSELGKLSNLIALSLNKNHLTGNIPPELAMIGSGVIVLQDKFFINLNDNNLEGCYPNELSLWCNSFYDINLSNNANLPNNGDFAQFCSTQVGVCQDSNTANCDALQFTSENNQTIVSGLTPQSKIEIIGRNTNWQIAPICDGNCSETQTISELMEGEYTVKVNQSGSEGSYCYREEKVDVQSASSQRASNNIHFATFQKEQAVQLQWAVNTIEQTDYFLIERSFDGDTFEPLTILANVAEDHTFHWTDEHPKTGNNHYRVRQIFQNNSSFYSTIESEEFFLQEQEITLFPNPAQDLLNLHLHKLKGKTGTILIYSIFGQQVAQYNNITFEENLQTIAVNGLENGLYWLSIKADNTPVISKRFVVERLR